MDLLEVSADKVQPCSFCLFMVPIVRQCFDVTWSEYNSIFNAILCRGDSKNSWQAEQEEEEMVEKTVLNWP